MSTRMMLTNVRLSYAHGLYSARPFAPGDTPSWFCAFHLDKVKHAKLIAEFEAAEFAEFEAKVPDKQKENARALFDALGHKDRRMKDGDIHDPEYAAGCMIVSVCATEGKQFKPIVLNRHRERVGEGDEGAPYSGCYVNAQVDVWAQFGTYTRTNCTLLAVQFVKDGDAFGGGRPADVDAFADLGDQGDEDELDGLA